jgi:transcription initiation factor TFIIH subunit 2
MADSDYDYEDDASDDEYIGAKDGAPGSRVTSTSRGRKEEQQPRQLQAWETEDTLSAVPFNNSTVEEAEDGTIQQSVQEREEARKRKR